MKVLLITSAPNLTTGYGRMGKAVAEYLSEKLGRENFEYVALTPNEYTQSFMDIQKYKIIPTRKELSDVDGRFTAAERITHFKPTIILTLGDLWQFDWIPTLSTRHTFKWTAWLPIDGAPIPSRWLSILDKIDMILSTSEWGKWVICSRERTYLKKTFVLRHGVDNKIFKPVSNKEEKIEAKLSLGFKPESYIIGCIARNQLRKNLPVLIGAFRKYLQPYIVCNNQECAITFGAGDECHICKNGKGKIFYKPPKFEHSLYLHTEAESDYGWDLNSMAKEMGISESVKIPTNIGPGIGCDDSKLAQIYRAMDVFALPTMGEGFGLPILEAMACGVPVIATDYSGHLDYAYGVSILLPIIARFREQITGMSRAIVDEDHLFQALDFLYYDKLNDAQEKHTKRLDWIERQLQALDANYSKDKDNRFGFSSLCGENLRNHMIQRAFIISNVLTIKNMNKNLFELLYFINESSGSVSSNTGVVLD